VQDKKRRNIDRDTILNLKWVMRGDPVEMEGEFGLRNIVCTRGLVSGRVRARKHSPNPSPL
jgi:hypothetical protein